MNPVTISFAGTVIEWRGPAPFFFVELDHDSSDRVLVVAQEHSYGWGCVPVRAESRGLTWGTSLIPRNGRFVLPLKDAIRRPAGLESGDSVNGRIHIGERPPAR